MIRTFDQEAFMSVLAFGACTSLCLDLLVSSTGCGAGVDSYDEGRRWRKDNSKESPLSV